jgi:succinate dehydrogenase/fumarate reductase-like Fe-S protein
MADAQITISVRTWSGNGQGIFQTHTVPLSGETDVLTALEHIRAHVDPTVAYRSSCRRGVCGGCLMIIDGEPRLACETEVRDGMEIDPYGAA